MAIKQQEKNFLIGIAAFGLAIGALIVVLPLLTGGSNSKAKETPPNKETVRVEVQQTQAVQPNNQSPEVDKPEKQRVQTTEKKKESAKLPAETTLVLSKPSKVPTDYFEDGSGSTDLPRVVERYLESVRNGSRFMGRLESIALRDNKALEEQRQSAKDAQNVALERGDLTKVISYNMKIKTPFLSAEFDAGTIDDFKGDVLVEWVDKNSQQRIELFFTPLSRDGALGRFRLNMPDNLAPPESEVYVYSATDDMPLIARGTYRP